MPCVVGRMFVCCNDGVKARARIELREEATEQDARDVIEIMKYRQVCTLRTCTQSNCRH